MIRMEFAQEARRLFDFYGRTPTEAALEEWWRCFREVPGDVFRGAVTTAIRGSRYMPTIQDLQKLVRMLGRSQSAPRTIDERPPIPEQEGRATGEFLESLGKAMTGEISMIDHIFNMRGIALKYRIQNKIDWAGLNGIGGFRVPQEWLVTRSASDLASPLEEGGQPPAGAGTEGPAHAQAGGTDSLADLPPGAEELI